MAEIAYPRSFSSDIHPLRLFVLLAALLLFSSECASSESQPRVPHIERDVCPFEGCQLGEWVAESPLTAYATEGDTSSVAFRIEPGEKLVALRGNLHVTNLGRVLVRERVKLDNSPHVFEKGDTVYVLSFRGEAEYLIWHKGIMMTVEVFWEDTPRVASAPRAILREAPEMIWWVLVRNAKGLLGWLRLRNTATLGFGFDEQIGGVDALR